MSDKHEIDGTQRRLLVPMNIEALVVPPNGTGESPWVDLKPDFRKINKNEFLGQDLEKEISINIQNKLHKGGVHLHWALPDGLTHGVSGDNGEGPEFPLIPNRWLIIRFWEGGKNNPASVLTSKAWIVESDYLYKPDEKTDEAAVTFPALDKAPLFDYVGKTFKYNGWKEQHGDSKIKLTALGYGDPAFAAYYPASRGILGFHDKDLEDLENATLNYFVAGWYSDPSEDPLHQALTEKTFDNLDEFLGERRWAYPGFDVARENSNTAKDLETDLKEAKEMVERIKKVQLDPKKEVAELQKQISDLEEKWRTLVQEVNDIQNNLPDQILCHGVITGIQWKDKDASYDSGVPRGKPFSVAVGNTAVEALTALFKKTLDNDELVRLLEAFQYDLMTELEKPDGHERVEQKIHERTFRPLSRAIRWDLIQETHPPADSSEECSPAIPGDIRMLLENLNHRQRLINRLKRERDSLKTELYATWYKKVLNAEERPESEKSLNQQLTDLHKEIDGLSDQITSLEDEKENRPKGAEWDQLQEKLDVFLPGYKLQPLDEPRFWRPNDPVVLLAGQAFRRSARHGEDGRFRTDGRLLCRLSGQEITKVEITVPHVKDVAEFGAGDLDKWCNPFPEPDSSPFPPDVYQSLGNLFRECLFLTLDSKRAHDIAFKVYDEYDVGNPEQKIGQLSKDLLQFIKDVLKNEKEDKNRETEILKFTGKFPSPVVINTWKNNPWLPLFLHWQASWIPAYPDASESLQDWNLKRQWTALEKDKSPQGKGQRYTGTTLLTPSAALNFSERLHQYNLTHDNPKLKTFHTVVGSMNLLCQSLGGLTDQLLMRKARLELQPLEPGSGERGPQPSPIFKQVEDVDWLSPLPDSQFFPVRAGHLKLKKLWVIDAFGQLLKLEDLQPEEKNRPGTVANPLVPERLAGPDGYVWLEPRLAQPARLIIQWPPAGRWHAAGEKDRPLQEDEEANPVCGWILPNFLDSSLMFYDARGNALGALQAVQRKSWEAGVGGKKDEIESFHWVDIPGSKDFFFGLPPQEITDPLGEKANPHLRAFVNGLLALAEGSGQAFGRLLDNMNQALSAAGGSASGHNPNLALLIGKPLALVRASIRLELDGQAACAQGWDDVKKDPKDRTGGIEKVKFPIRLGDRRKWNDVWLGDDGLVGFSLDQDYSRFYPAYGLQGCNDSYSEYEKVPELSVAKPLDLTLLMDPSRGVCATTGILPRKIFNLPYGDITDTLENKQIVFFTGPLVSTAAEIRMPTPSDIYGQWSWTHHPEVKVWREEPITDSRKEQGQFFEGSLQIAEGWLKLITAPLAIRVFTVKGKKPVNEEEKLEKDSDAPIPAQFEASQGDNIVLSWAVIGADEVELQEQGDSLFKCNRHPLPTQYGVQVDKDTSFTLKTTDRAKQTVQKTIKINIVQKRIHLQEASG